MNTLGLPARARYFCTVTCDADAVEALGWAAERDLAVLVLGGGSNCVFTGDVDGLVIHMGIQQRSIQGDRIEFGAGENWDAAVRFSIDQGFSGLECLALIPGSVGAAPVQNIGAYGVELCQLAPRVRVWDRRAQQTRWIESAEAEYGYRDSLFKRDIGRFLILSVSLKLSRQAADLPSYPDLQAELSALAAPSARDIADAVTRVRRRKLPDPAVLGNAGSFFKNPIVVIGVARELKAQYPEMPQFPHQGEVKLSAGWLIDQCGFKGAVRGSVGVSPAHALVLVHHGGGTGQDLMALAREIQRSVFERYGVQLEPEPRVI